MKEENVNELLSKIKTLYEEGDKSNANADSSLISSKNSITRGYLAKLIYQNQLNEEENKATKDGFLYIHDMDNMMSGSFNCCLFDMESILTNGFQMCGLNYKEPNSVLSALQVIGDVTLSASSQQFGGFTIAEIDKILVKYIKKSINNLEQEQKLYGIQSELYVTNKLKEELAQGFQSLEMKLNSIPSSRGDFAFTTLSFGCFDGDPEDFAYQKMVIDAILEQRMKGHGKGEPVPFPKLVMIYSKEQHETLDFYDGLMDKAIDCTTKTMYPDYLAIDTVGYVSDMYRKYKKIISPMG